VARRPRYKLLPPRQQLLLLTQRVWARGPAWPGAGFPGVGAWAWACLQMVAVIDSVTWLVLVPMLVAAEQDPARKSYWLDVYHNFESYNVGGVPPYCPSC
jgi:hypothetical protein